MNPNDAETAAQLRRAHEQQKLSALFSRCQKLYENGDKQGALACFRQVRVAGGNYKNVNSLITMMQTESAPLQPLPPSPAPSRWGFGLLAGVIVAVVVGVVGLSLLLVLLNSSADGPQPEPSNQNVSNQSFASPTTPASPPAVESSPEDQQPPVTAVTSFEPVGRWRISAPNPFDNSQTVELMRLDLKADQTFSLTAQADGLSVDGAGSWEYSPAGGTLTLTTVDQTSDTLQIKELHGDHFHIYHPEIGNADMTRIGNANMKRQ